MSEREGGGGGGDSHTPAAMRTPRSAPVAGAASTPSSTTAASSKKKRRSNVDGEKQRKRRTSSAAAGGSHEEHSSPAPAAPTPLPEDWDRSEARPTVRVPRAPAAKEAWQRVIVVLERACLETVAVGGKYELLSGEEHGSLMRKAGRDPGTSRPDILHQCLLALLDSPLSKAGKLQVLFRSEAGVLVEMSPTCRLPRTYSRFAGLMVQLLHAHKIRASGGADTLLKLVKNPVTRHLPPNGPRILMSTEGKLTDIWRLPETLEDEDGPPVFVIGAMAHGHVTTDYTTRTVSISDFPLSGAAVCSRVCSTYERHFSIL